MHDAGRRAWLLQPPQPGPRAPERLGCARGQPPWCLDLRRHALQAGTARATHCLIRSARRDQHPRPTATAQGAGAGVLCNSANHLRQERAAGHDQWQILHRRRLRRPHTADRPYEAMMPVTRPGRLADCAEYLLVCREPAGRLLRVGQPAVHSDLKDTAPRSAQRNLRVRPGIAKRFCRRTGARFVASHAAIFDFDLHGSGLPLWTPVPG